MQNGEHMNGMTILLNEQFQSSLNVKDACIQLTQFSCQEIKDNR